MLTLDGSLGEGGGQILRTALALSLLTQTPFTIQKIRAGRARPGLLRQHLTAVRAAQTISHASVTGAELHSTQLTFHPGKVSPGDYHFATGSAGSTSLILQTLLPPLLLQSAPSTLTLEGGTHNPFAPTFDFLSHTFLPLLNTMGPNVTAHLHRPGFYPAGGGKATYTINPAPLQPLSLLERGAPQTPSATLHISALPPAIALRERTRLLAACPLFTDAAVKILQHPNPAGPGNVLSAHLPFQHLTETFTAFAERGIPAETIAQNLANDIAAYLQSDAWGGPVGEYLADQLMLPCALAAHFSNATSTYKTGPLSDHSTTNIHTIQRFLPIRIAIQTDGPATTLTFAPQ